MRIQQMGVFQTRNCWMRTDRPFLSESYLTRQTTRKQNRHKFGIGRKRERDHSVKQDRRTVIKPVQDNSTQRVFLCPRMWVNFQHEQSKCEIVQWMQVYIYMCI